MLAIVSHRKHIEFTFLVSSILKLTEMLLSADRGQTVQKRFLMRSLKLLGQQLEMPKKMILKIMI